MRKSTEAEVTVIIPAYRAESTLAQALDSLLAQTLRAWNAIVVDDGSDDATLEIAETYRLQDPRILVHSQPNRGVSAARNAGIALATAPWLLFLDADDLLAPDALAGFMSAAALEPGCDCVHAGWVMVTADGRETPERYVHGHDDLLNIVQSHSPFAMHAGVIRRERVVEVGGFDPALRTGEDWDLLLRIADTGARFHGADGCWSYYRIRRGSASLDGRQMLGDLMSIADRAYRDEWWPATDLLSATQRRSHIRAGIAAYCAGLDLAQGLDGRPMLDALVEARPDVMWADGLADSLYDALDLAVAAASGNELVRPWPSAGITAFLAALERRAQAPGLGRRTQRILERRFVRSIVAEARPVAIGRTLAIAVDLNGPVPDIAAAPEQDRLHCLVAFDGEVLRPLELPIRDGVVPGPVLADAAIAANTAEIMRAVVVAPAVSRLHRLTAALRRRAIGLGRRAGHRLLDAIGRQSRLGLAITRRSAHWPDVGWVDARVFLDELWGAQGRESRVAPLRRADGSQGLDLEVALPLTDLLVDGPVLPVRVQAGGQPVGEVTVPAPSGRLRGAELRAAIDTALGPDLCRTALRAILAGDAARDEPIRQRLARAAAASAQRGPEPDVRPDLEPALAPMAGEVSGTAVDHRGRPERSRRVTTATLPILMYHRIVPGNGRPRDRWSLTPDRLEEQLAYLADAGYRSVEPSEWQEAVRERRPVEGRGVMLTFDDGTVDFIEHAAPLLERYGFTATLFLVSGLIGQRTAWETGPRAEVPIMGWEELKDLQRRGFTFGAHGATHAALTALDDAEIVGEVSASRAALVDGLGERISTFAYPFGDLDPATRHLVGTCGLEMGFTCRPGSACFHDDLLDLPRIEVRGWFELPDFAQSLPAA